MDERVKLIAEITTKLLVGGYKMKGSNDLLDVYQAAAVAVKIVAAAVQANETQRNRY